jgi:hypothetical protein
LMRGKVSLALAQMRCFELSKVFGELYVRF